MPYFTGVNNTFTLLVSKTFGYKSKELDALLVAVSNHQQLPNKIQVHALRTAFNHWRQTKPVEYTNRLGNSQIAVQQELEAEYTRWYPQYVFTDDAYNWVDAVRPELDAMSEFAVGDVLAFRGNSTHEAIDRCLARYLDFADPAQPAPARHQPYPPALLPLPLKAWSAPRALAWFNYARYLVPRSPIRYDLRAVVGGLEAGVPTVHPAGAYITQATGCTVCTGFAFAAAHVLTVNRPVAPNTPRVEVVAWRPSPIIAHLFVIVGRNVGAGHDVNAVLPPPEQWGNDAVIVDTWLAALGRQSVFRPTSQHHPFDYFLKNLRIEMERPAG